MALECILILVMTVELLLVILSVIEGSREYSEWSGEMAGPATAMFTYAETGRESIGTYGKLANTIRKKKRERQCPLVRFCFFRGT